MACVPHECSRENTLQRTDSGISKLSCHEPPWERGAMLAPSRLFSKDDSIASSMRRIGQSRHSCGISWVSSVPNKFRLEPLLSIRLTHTLINTRFISTSGITQPTQLSWAASQREPQTSTCLRCLYHQRVANMYANSIYGAGVGYLSGGKYHVRICLAYLSVQVPSTCLSVRCILSSHDLNAKELRVQIVLPGILSIMITIARPGTYRCKMMRWIWKKRWGLHEAFT